MNNHRAKEIIEQIVYITLATVSPEGQPWNSPVYTAYDENFNFYWGSHKDSQHSMNIAANDSVFLVIYDSTVPAGDGEGVYIQAKAHELTDQKEIAKAHAIIQARRPIPYWKLDEVQSTSPVHIFKAIPQQVWINGEGQIDGVYVDTRKGVDLS